MCRDRSDVSGPPGLLLRPGDDEAGGDADRDGEDVQHDGQVWLQLCRCEADNPTVERWA